MMVTNNELIGSTLTTDAVSEAAAESEDNAPVGVKSKSHVGVKHRLGNCRGRGIIRVGVVQVWRIRTPTRTRTAGFGTHSIVGEPARALEASSGVQLSHCLPLYMMLKSLVLNRLRHS